MIRRIFLVFCITLNGSAILIPRTQTISFSEAIIGVEAPQYLIMQSAKNAVDFYSQDINKLLGEEGKALREKIWPLIRKVEYKQGWSLPGLSYIPKEEQTEK